MRWLAMLMVLFVSFVARGSSGTLLQYKGIMDARYLGKRVYWLQKTPSGGGVPISAVITKVLIPDINDDTIGQGNTRRIKFEVRAGDEYEPSLSQPVRAHDPRLDESIQTDGFGMPQIRRYYNDEEGGRWGLEGVDDEDVFFYYDVGNVGYTIDIEQVIQEGFAVSRRAYSHKHPDGVTVISPMLDARVHFQLSPSSTPEHYTGTVIGLAPPSAPGGSWRLRIKQLSAAGALDDPRVFNPSETITIEAGDIVGPLKLSSRKVGRMLTYGYKDSPMVRGRIVGIYTSGYWEIMNYERIGTEGVVEPYLYLIHKDDITGAVARAD